jgi:hypothetical protein
LVSLTFQAAEIHLDRIFDEKYLSLTFRAAEIHLDRIFDEKYL